MKIIKSVLLLSLFFFITNCGDPIPEESIYGEWQADLLIEKGKNENRTLKNVKFEFLPEGSYALINNNSTSEAGNYYITNDLLYTIDTLNAQRIKKSVKITHISSDSLFFDMNKAGVKQIMKLSRPK